MKILKYVAYYFVFNFLFFVLSILYFIHYLLAILGLIFFLYLFIKYLLRKKKTIVNIDSMTGIEFEEYLYNLFKQSDFRIQRTPVTNDFGADLILYNKKGIKTAIQAKRYSKPVGSKAVQEVLSAKHYYNCQRAIVITNNTFTRSAKQLAWKTGIELWNRSKLDKFST